MKDTDNCNFADDTKTFICDRITQKVLNSFDENAELAICWLENNFMKLNTVCHLLILRFKHQAMWAKTGKDRWEKYDIKLLDVTIDKNLGFNP